MSRRHPTTLLHEDTQLDAEKHPIFGRVIKENPHYLPSGKEINLMWEMICQRLPNKSVYFHPSDLKQKAHSQFRAIYAIVENLFNDNFRSDGTPYFYHLLETAFILLEESNLENLRIEDIFVAILHDTIEDTKLSFNSLVSVLNYKGKEIALGVHLISKPPFNAYIDDEKENERYSYILGNIQEENIDLSGNIIDESIVDNKILDEYNSFRDKFKPIRNRKHFENYTDFKTFFEYAKQEAKNLGIPYKDEWLEKVCIRSINVKLADRLHNLRTLGHMNEKRVIKKIHETRKYILGIADEINPSLAEKIRLEINKLEGVIMQRMFGEISGGVKDSIALQIS